MFGVGLFRCEAEKFLEFWLGNDTRPSWEDDQSISRTFIRCEFVQVSLKDFESINQKFEANKNHLAYLARAIYLQACWSRSVKIKSSHGNLHPNIQIHNKVWDFSICLFSAAAKWTRKKFVEHTANVRWWWWFMDSHSRIENTKWSIHQAAAVVTKLR